jgi:predicted esterase
MRPKLKRPELLFALLFGCAKAEAARQEPVPVHAPVPAPASPEPQGELPPLQGDWLERIELPDHQLIFVAPPVGARAPRPIVVAVHGAGDRPDWACGGWRLGTEAFAFVVCPQGFPMRGQTFAWTDDSALLHAVDRALLAVRERYGGHVANVPAIYAGFSQGATLAAKTLLARTRDFPLAVFAEGGYDTTIDATFARKYQAAGGQRALLLCGTPNCFAHSRRAARVLETAGITTTVAGDAKSGHNLNEPMQRALREIWPGFVHGVAGWEGYGTTARP